MIVACRSKSKADKAIEELCQRRDNDDDDDDDDDDYHVDDSSEVGARSRLARTGRSACSALDRCATVVEWNRHHPG